MRYWHIMKRSLFFICFAAALTPAFAQGGDFSSDKDVSYAIGVLLAKSLSESGVKVEFSSFANGLREMLSGKPALSEDAAAERVQAAMDAAFAKTKDDNLKQSVKFLSENKKKKGITTTKSGLQYEVLEKGKGEQPRKDSVVVVHYTGTLPDGTVFDSSREGAEPATIPLEHVIPGWAEGIQLMHVGGRTKLFIPPELGYGEAAGLPEIPPNSVLIFDVELLEIEPAK